MQPLVGRDGWLFLTGDTNDVLGQHTGRVQPGKLWELRWRRVLAARKRLVSGVDASWVHCLIPDKESVYAEQLPPEIEVVPRRPIHRFLEIARSMGVPAMFPLDEMRAARDRGLIFHETDTHWTYLGAHVVYELVCDELERRGFSVPRVDPDDILFETTEEAGDLGSKLDPPHLGHGLDATLRSERAELVFDSGVHLTGRVGVWEADIDAPTAVMFGTSYSTLGALFFKESFRRMVFVHGNSLDGKLIRREKPDVLLTMPAERGVVRIPPDWRAHRYLAKIAGRKPPARSPIVSSWRG